MKRIYKNFIEIAYAFIDGDSWTHMLSEHSSADCYTWQNAIKEFAFFLDSAGIKIIQNPEIYEKLWEEMRKFKIKKYKKYLKKNILVHYRKNKEPF